MIPLAPTKLAAKTPFEAGYKPYIETALRLVIHELERIDQHDSVEINPDVERLSAIKCALQIAMDNIERDYTQEAKAIDTLQSQLAKQGFETEEAFAMDASVDTIEKEPWRGIHAKPSATLYHFGTKAD